jgi:hypothetical protein
VRRGASKLDPARESIARRCGRVAAAGAYVARGREACGGVATVRRARQRASTGRETMTRRAVGSAPRGSMATRDRIAGQRCRQRGGEAVGCGPAPGLMCEPPRRGTRASGVSGRDEHKRKNTVQRQRQRRRQQHLRHQVLECPIPANDNVPVGLSQVA